MHACMCVCECECMYVYVSMYVCIYVCVGMCTYMLTSDYKEMKANMVTRQINLPCSISVCLQFNSILVYLKDQGY